MARKNKADGDYSYHRTAVVRGREDQGRFAVIERNRDHTRVVMQASETARHRARGYSFQLSDVLDLKPTEVVPTGQRGTITLPSEFRRDLGIEEGTPLEIIREDDGRLSIRPLTPISTPGSGDPTC